MNKHSKKNILAPVGKSAREYLQLSGDPARFAQYREAAGRAGSRTVQEWILARCDAAVIAEVQRIALPVGAAGFALPA